MDGNFSNDVQLIQSPRNEVSRTVRRGNLNFSFTNGGKQGIWSATRQWAFPSFCFAIWSSPHKLSESCIMVLTGSGPPIHLPCRRRWRFASRKRAELGADKYSAARQADMYRCKLLIGWSPRRKKTTDPDKDMFSMMQNSLLNDHVIPCPASRIISRVCML